MLTRLGPVFSIRSLLFFLFFLFIACHTHVQAQTIMDAPHNLQGCTSCHDMSAFDQPNLIPGGSEIVYEDICLGCHDGSEARMMPGHSSATTSTKYGSWTVGCPVCHNQHTQESAGGGFVRKKIDLSKITITPANRKIVRSSVILYPFSQGSTPIGPALSKDITASTVTFKFLN